MAMLLFSGLNGLGVVFLLYVLVQFWKEGHRSKMRDTRDRMTEYWRENNPTVVVVKDPITCGLRVEPAPVSHPAHGGLSLVSRQARITGLRDRPLHQDTATGAGVTSSNRLPKR